MKKTFEVKLLNQKFNLRSDSDQKHVQKVADFVNKKLFHIQEKTPSVSSLNVALLAALNIADDYYKIKADLGGGTAEVQTKIKEIVNFIDQALQES